MWCDAIEKRPCGAERTSNRARREIVADTLCPPRDVVAEPWTTEKPGSGQAVHRFTGHAYFGAAFTFVPSFTGGSILMFGP
jgi:hypothetical protein